MGSDDFLKGVRVFHPRVVRDTVEHYPFCVRQCFEEAVRDVRRTEVLGAVDQQRGYGDPPTGGCSVG